MSELAEPIRELSKDKVPFNWGPEPQAAFIQMKKKIASAPILAYYNPKKQTTLQTRCQCQRSWCLSPTWWQTSIFCKQCSHQCPERLCGDWARISYSGFGNGEISSFPLCQSFSTWKLETDQELLEAILSKSINQATPRLQRIHIWTFAYHFTVKYIPGSTNHLADCLSHLGGQKDTIKLPSCIFIKSPIN